MPRPSPAAQPAGVPWRWVALGALGLGVLVTLMQVLPRAVDPERRRVDEVRSFAASHQLSVPGRYRSAGVERRGICDEGCGFSLTVDERFVVRSLVYDDRHRHGRRIIYEWTAPGALVARESATEGPEAETVVTFDPPRVRVQERNTGRNCLTDGMEFTYVNPGARPFSPGAGALRLDPASKSLQMALEWVLPESKDVLLPGVTAAPDCRLPATDCLERTLFQDRGPDWTQIQIVQHGVCTLPAFGGLLVASLVVHPVTRFDYNERGQRGSSVGFGPNSRFKLSVPERLFLGVKVSFPADGPPRAVTAHGLVHNLVRE